MDGAMDTTMVTRGVVKEEKIWTERWKEGGGAEEGQEGKET